jgi:hypothetical protein
MLQKRQKTVILSSILHLVYRPKLRHAEPTSVIREAELEPPSRVACSDLIVNPYLTINFLIGFSNVRAGASAGTF